MAVTAKSAATAGGSASERCLGSAFEAFRLVPPYWPRERTVCIARALLLDCARDDRVGTATGFEGITTGSDVDCGEGCSRTTSSCAIGFLEIGDALRRLIVGLARLFSENMSPMSASRVGEVLYLKERGGTSMFERRASQQGWK